MKKVIQRDTIVERKVEKTPENEIVCGYRGQCRFKNKPSMKIVAKFSRRCVDYNIPTHDMCAGGDYGTQKCPNC